MTSARSWRIHPEEWEILRNRVFRVMVVVFALVPVSVSGSWNEVNTILHEAYGEQAARECQELYQSLDLADDQVAAVREGIAILVEAGYPSGCPDRKA